MFRGKQAFACFCDLMKQPFACFLLAHYKQVTKHKQPFACFSKIPKQPFACFACFCLFSSKYIGYLGDSSLLVLVENLCVYLCG